MHMDAHNFSKQKINSFMKIQRRRPRGQRLLAAMLSSCKSIGSFLLTRYRKFYRKGSTFFRSVVLKRRKDRVISHDKDEKRPTHMVGDIDSTLTIPKSGDFTTDPTGAHEGPVIPQGPSLIESGELPHKRPRDKNAVTPSPLHQSPAAGKRNLKRQSKTKTCPRPDTAAKGDDVSILKLETPEIMDIKMAEHQDIGMTSGEAQRISRKRKAPASEDRQPGTSPPAKNTAVENIIRPSTKVHGNPVLETPKVEMPGSWRQQTINILPPEQLSILKSKGQEGMLDDDIINKAQELLQKQFEDSDGLQPVAALLVPGFSVLMNAVQIHYDEDRVHWLTTCFKDGKILVADSIRNNYLTPSIREQICNVYSEVVPEPLKHLTFLNVDQQRNNYDCGVFAIAFAYELLAEDGEPTAMFDHNIMRNHLISCLQRGRITAFPKKVSKWLHVFQ